MSSVVAVVVEYTENTEKERTLNWALGTKDQRKRNVAENIVAVIVMMAITLWQSDVNLFIRT